MKAAALPKERVEWVNYFWKEIKVVVLEEEFVYVGS